MVLEPYDDEDISSDDRIVRRIIPEQHVVPDEHSGRCRLSTKLMKPSGPERGGGMSVDLLELIVAAGVPVEEFLSKPPFTAAVCFTAGSAREKDLMIGKDPIDNAEDQNPFHGEVWSKIGNPNKFSRSQSNALLAASSWVIRIDGVDIVTE